MSNLRLVRLSSFIVILFAACLTGCGGDSDATGGDSTESTSTGTASQTKVAGDIEQRIQGIWLGEAVLNESLVEQKLQTLPVERQQEIVRRAQSFLSTILAIEFRNNGTMENEVSMISQNGQQLREGTTGAWKIIERQGNQFVMETIENLPDGTQDVSQRLYEISDDGNQIALKIPLQDELGTCEPYILMTRQNMSGENVAQSPANTVVK